MDSGDAWAAVSAVPFVSLTTYRRNGVGVPTPVWVAADGDELVVTTEAHVGKVKRLRNDDRVRLQPCSRLGRVDPDAPVVEGRCRIAGPDGDHPSAIGALRRKYGVQYTLVLLVERTVRRVQRRPAERLILAITAA